MQSVGEQCTACVTSVEFVRGFTLLCWLNLWHGLYCFGFYGCTVVYPVPHKFVLMRKLMMACTYKHVPHAIGQGFGVGYRPLKRTAPKTLITTNY